MAEKKEQKYTTGRAALGSLAGWPHAAVAGKQGRKIEGSARSFGYGFGGALAGVGVNAATKGKASLAPTVGGVAGSYGGFRVNNKKGVYRPQKVKKNDTTSAFGVEHGEFSKGIPRSVAGGGGGYYGSTLRQMSSAGKQGKPTVGLKAKKSLKAQNKTADQTRRSGTSTRFLP